MKGCARSLLLQLAGLLATIGAAFFFFQQRYGLPPSKSLGASLFAGFFAWLGWTFFIAVAEPLRERSALRHSLSGQRPADGKRAGIVGTIDAPGQSLRAPLSGADCVAFQYEIWRMVAGGRRRTKAVYFEGIALVPSVITTLSGTYRLLAVPTFDFGAEGIEGGEAVRRWKEYAPTAPFEAEGSARGGLEKQWTDDDGAYRRERAFPAGAEVPLEKCTFRENLIRRGDSVYAVGLFSEARGGLVPDPNWARQTRIMKGDANSILRQLRGRIVKYVVGGILSGAAAAGIALAFVSHAGR